LGALALHRGEHRPRLGLEADVIYGVLRGRPDRWVREEGDATPHLQIRLLDDTDAAWRIAVNVQSDTGSEVVFWLVDPLVAHPVLTSLAGLPSGFSTVAGTPDHALDYVKAPLFDWTKGRALPASGQAAADDLQDLLALYLEQCKAVGGEVYAFGAKFDRNLHKPIDADFGNSDGLHGIHDIHLNQGNVGSHASDNGTYHDGGLLLVHPDRVIGLFLGFQTQRVPTDDAGAPTSTATPLGGLVAPTRPVTPTPGPAPSPGPTPTIYLERALVNPLGADPGLEVVVIGNLATTATALDGWTLKDKNGRTTTVGAVTSPPGGSVLIVLDGAGVQLGNKGGNLILSDPAGSQVDVVVYTSDDARPEDRYVRFRR
jgi:uncharacterized protein YukJ